MTSDVAASDAGGVASAVREILPASFIGRAMRNAIS